MNELQFKSNRIQKAGFCNCIKESGTAKNKKEAMECNQTIDNEVPREAGIIALSVMPFIMIISVAGNSLIVWLTFKLKILSVPMNILVINLATCNIIITIFPGLMFTVENAIGKWPFEDLFCRVSVGVEYSILTYSNAIMVGIAIEQYFAVVLPFKNLVTRRTTRWILIAGWTASIVVQIGYILLMTPSLPSEVLASPNSECHIGWAASPVGLSGGMLIYYVAAFILLIAIPFLIMLGLYSKIIYVTKRAQRPGGHTRTTKLRERKRKQRMVKMLVATLILFQICWMPSFIQEFLISAGAEAHLSSSQIQILNLITSIMGYSHSALNPLTYPIFNRQYRTAVKEFFQSLIKAKTITQKIRKDEEDQIESQLSNKVFFQSFKTARVIPEEKRTNGDDQVESPV